MGGGCDAILIVNMPRGPVGSAIFGYAWFYGQGWKSPFLALAKTIELPVARHSISVHILISIRMWKRDDGISLSAVFCIGNSVTPPKTTAEITAHPVSRR